MTKNMTMSENAIDEFELNKADGVEDGGQMLDDNGQTPDEVPNLKKRKILTRETKIKIFYAVMLIFPLAMFAIFYVYINISSFVMAFTKFKVIDGNRVQVGNGFKNFVRVFEWLLGRNGATTHIKAFTNSLWFFFFSTAIGTTLSLLMAYYVYKKFLFSEFFKVVLFLPNLISQMLMMVLFKEIVNNMYPALFNLDPRMGLLLNQETRLGTIIFFNLWLGFASQIVMYSSAMSGINDAIVESAQLDGINAFKEFWLITMPMIFPTFITFLVTSMAQIFTNQMSLYTFYGDAAGGVMGGTIGYFMYIYSKDTNNLYREIADPNRLTYNELAACGLIISLITVPLIVTVKKLLEKYGPSAG